MDKILNAFMKIRQPKRPAPLVFAESPPDILDSPRSLERKVPERDQLMRYLRAPEKAHQLPQPEIAEEGCPSKDSGEESRLYTNFNREYLRHQMKSIKKKFGIVHNNAVQVQQAQEKRRREVHWLMQESIKNISPRQKVLPDIVHVAKA